MKLRQMMTLELLTPNSETQSVLQQRIDDAIAALRQVRSAALSEVSEDCKHQAEQMKRATLAESQRWNELYHQHKAPALYILTKVAEALEGLGSAQSLLNEPPLPLPDLTLTRMRRHS
jgi:hypothetical protein